MVMTQAVSDSIVANAWICCIDSCDSDSLDVNVVENGFLSQFKRCDSNPDKSAPRRADPTKIIRFPKYQGLDLGGPEL
jgi:hypothetical protein